MAVAANADDYAAPRQNVFFPGVVPSLDGQCVSLVKAFLQDMTSVPNPQSARGDARYMGHTLVNQGHATEVPYAERKRGDIIGYEYGVYGHIGVVLSGNRTFEENVNWPGVASKIVDGDRVYASRIGSLGEGWRHDQHIYRIKSYSEGGNMEPFNEGDRVNLNVHLYGQDLGLHHGLIGKPFKEALYAIFDSPEDKDARLVNGGDITNYLRFFAGVEPTDADFKFHNGGTHKRTIYDLMSRADVQAKVSGGVKPKKLDPGVYEVK